jgi:tripartite-type tricarboxylate transporter receptor subunit TctC
MKVAARLVAIAAAVLTAGAVQAASYPDHPVKIVVPFAPAGPTDVMARLIAQKLSESLKQQFYVENHPGAGGNIGMVQVAKSAPDGYTILVASSSFVVNPSLYAKNPYDPFKDFGLAEHPGGECRLPSQNGQRACRSRHEKSGQVQLRDARYWHDTASCR